jgi:hypothetical protein
VRERSVGFTQVVAFNQSRPQFTEISLVTQRKFFTSVPHWFQLNTIQHYVLMPDALYCCVAAHAFYLLVTLPMCSTTCDVVELSLLQRTDNTTAKLSRSANQQYSTAKDICTPVYYTHIVHLTNYLARFVERFSKLPFRLTLPPLVLLLPLTAAFVGFLLPPSYTSGSNCSSISA